MIPIIAGLESHAHRNTLKEALSLFESVGFYVPRFLGGVSYKMLVERQVSLSYLESLKEEDGFDLIITSGYHSDKDTPVEDLIRAIDEYHKFLGEIDPYYLFAIQLYNDRIPLIDLEIPRQHRIVPMLSDPTDTIELGEILAEHGMVASDADVSKACAGLLRGVGDEVGPLISHSSGVDLRKIWANGFQAFMLRHWYWASRYGQLLVWDGAKIRRFDSDTPKEDITKDFSAYIESTGLSVDDVVARESRSVNILALASFFTALEQLMAHGAPQVESDMERTGGGEDDARESSASITSVPRVEREAGKRVPLPVLQPDMFSGGIALTENDIRQCNNCFIKQVCPSFTKGASCAYSFPVSVRSDDQVRELLHTMIELQTKRVAFARFAEELNGGLPDPMVGEEMDRLMRMADKLRQSEQRREKFTLSFEAEQSGDGPNDVSKGVLSRLFGSPQKEEPKVIEGTEPESDT